MRVMTAAGIDLIKHYEGFSPTIYLCAGGYPTIGYGHVVGEGEDFADGIDLKWAEELLRRDVAYAQAAVLRLINVPLTDGHYDALVSFTFNLGAGALQRSTLRRVINREVYEAAPNEFRRWVWAGGRKLRGLVRRREAEILLYTS